MLGWVYSSWGDRGFFVVLCTRKSNLVGSNKADAFKMKIKLQNAMMYLSQTLFAPNKVNPHIKIVIYSMCRILFEN
jgi:hypothetical protein